MNAPDTNHRPHQLIAPFSVPTCVNLQNAKKRKRVMFNHYIAKRDKGRRKY
jgi:hypothetical protein